MRVRLTVIAVRVSHKPEVGCRRRRCPWRQRATRGVRRRRSDCAPSPLSDTFPPFMQVGVPKETAEGEQRVALVPEVVGKLKAKGLDVLVQAGAGEAALLPDD